MCVRSISSSKRQRGSAERGLPFLLREQGLIAITSWTRVDHSRQTDVAQGVCLRSASPSFLKADFGYPFTCLFRVNKFCPHSPLDHLITVRPTPRGMTFSIGTQMYQFLRTQVSYLYNQTPERWKRYTAVITIPWGVWNHTASNAEVFIYDSALAYWCMCRHGYFVAEDGWCGFCA